ncbi:methyl-accepting chemotaxis protein (plasmid) [Rhizobium sp. CIAT894]|uniref:HAMP domain-containing methyl-accepting chemotaxis protein n=1 Tax=Rhizobium sp. CIAT894 TaxID=2020312 RepID=UPI000A1F4089|nr:HAMP domain-containing methyl-accepting chemotaxis protein [Rhizobium sp. CIAT894]ARM92624.1 methyl-accepting chemotaxis protein [Rhizobium sp. CIAT894]
MRITLKFTLFGLFGTLVAISLGQGILGLRSLSTIKTASRSIALDTVPSMLTLSQLNVDYGDMRVAHLGYVLARDTTRQEILSDLSNTTGQISKDLQDYQPAITSDAERAIYQNFVSADAAYQQIWQRAKTLADTGKPDDAMTLLLGEGRTSYDAAGDLIQKDVDINVADNNNNLTTADAAVEFSVTSAIVALAIAFAAGMAAIILSHLRVIAPLSQMSTYMNTLRGGDTAREVPGRERSDEIGEMAVAVEKFRQALIANSQLEAETEQARAQAEKDRITAQQQAEAEAAERLRIATSGLAIGLKRLASGDLAFQLDGAFAADFEALRHDFNSSVQQLAATLSAISTATVTIDGGTREISQGANDLSTRTEQQAASLEQTAAALDEITTNVVNSSNRAEEARVVANQANASALRSGEVVARAVNAMSRIEESSNQISNIIGVIDEIAFQTNLLALNAGVEAARAGEAGKGFAVVAQEVRELAQRSATAAKEIKALIRTSNAEVSDGVKLVSETGEVLKTIEIDVATINDHIEAIATSAREQSVGLSEVNVAVNQMDQVTQKNAAMVEETTAASTSLANEAKMLTQLVERFKLSGDRQDPRREPVAPSSSAVQTLGNRVAAAFGRGYAA